MRMEEIKRRKKCEDIIRRKEGDKRRRSEDGDERLAYLCFLHQVF